MATIAAGLSLLALLVGAGRALAHRRLPPAHTWQAAVVMVFTTGARVTSYVQFSLNVAFQDQGRLLFLALLPAGLVFTDGVHALAPGRWGKTLGLNLLLAWLALMNAAALAAAFQA